MSFGSGSGSGAPGPLTSLSFIPGLLSSAFFGTGLGLDDGGFRIQPEGAHPAVANVFEGGEGPLAGQLDPDTLLGNILDQLSPDFNTGVSGARDFLSQGLGQGSGVIDAAGQATRTLSEGLETGFKPDLQPVIEAANRNFFEEIVPQLGEQNVALQEGVGPFSTDLSSSLLRAGTDLSTDLGALETQLQSQAGQTRASLAGISGTVLNQLGQQPFNLSSGALDAGAQVALEGTAAGRQSQLLQLLTGQINPVQGNQQGGSSSSGSKSGAF